MASCQRNSTPLVNTQNEAHNKETTLLVHKNQKLLIFSTEVKSLLNFMCLSEIVVSLRTSLGQISDPAFSNPSEITDSPPVNILVKKADFMSIVEWR